MDRHIKAPLDEGTAAELKSGDYVYITGTIYTARDAAHKRMYETLAEGKELPFDLKNNMIYYMGPSPAREGHGAYESPGVALGGLRESGACRGPVVAFIRCGGITKGASAWHWPRPRVPIRIRKTCRR